VCRSVVCLCARRQRVALRSTRAAVAAGGGVSCLANTTVPRPRPPVPHAKTHASVSPCSWQRRLQATTCFPKNTQYVWLCVGVLGSCCCFGQLVGARCRPPHGFSNTWDRARHADLTQLASHTTNQPRREPPTAPRTANNAHFSKRPVFHFLKCILFGTRRLRKVQTKQKMNCYCFQKMN
jgi:hypothetical protein